MNGRLYDPLLRRFLNADENIQDPYNTQNYNKYGYVLNNPLMFNDPRGEFVWATGFFLTYVAPVIWGAVVGTLISVGMYTIQSLVMNSWSWNGFANALLMGAVTGGVSGGLGQIFSASGFWGTVGNGALAGAGTGGVTALINGDNFLKVLATGAVIGGAIAAVSYTVNYYAQGYNKTNYKTVSSEIKSNDTPTYDINISRDTMQNDIDIMRSKNFTLSEMDQFGVGRDTLGYGGFDGYIYPGDGSKVYAYTIPKNFWTGKSDIVYAPITAQNKKLLAATMVHETGHAYSQKIGLLDVQLKSDSSEHLGMAKLEHLYADRNFVTPTERLNSGFYWRPSVISRLYNNLDQISRSIVDNAYNKLMPVFNRFMFYTK